VSLTCRLLLQPSLLRRRPCLQELRIRELLLHQQWFAGLQVSMEALLAISPSSPLCRQLECNPKGHVLLQSSHCEARPVDLKPGHELGLEQLLHLRHPRLLIAHPTLRQELGRHRRNPIQNPKSQEAWVQSLDRAEACLVPARGRSLAWASILQTPVARSRLQQLGKIILLRLRFAPRQQAALQLHRIFCNQRLEVSKKRPKKPMIRLQRTSRETHGLLLEQALTAKFLAMLRKRVVCSCP